MLRIESDTSIWRKEIASKAIKGLDSLQSSLTIDALAEKPEPDETLIASIDNLHFVHEQISPIVEDYFALIKKQQVEFGNGFSLRSLTPVGSRVITYNYPDLPNRLGFSFTSERRPAEVTEDMLRRLFLGQIDVDAVEGLGKLSKEEILQKFRYPLTSSIK